MTRRDVVLSGEAEKDFADIISWTTDMFGARQALAYGSLITEAVTELGKSGEPRTSRARDEIETGIRSLHVARRKRPGRHLLLYRREKERTLILRILHDAMDIAHHLSKDKA